METSILLNLPADVRQREEKIRTLLTSLNNAEATIEAKRALVQELSSLGVRMLKCVYDGNARPKKFPLTYSEGTYYRIVRETPYFFWVDCGTLRPKRVNKITYLETGWPLREYAAEFVLIN